MQSSFASFTAANFAAKCAFQKTEVPFNNSTTGCFTVFKIDFNKFIAAICPDRKFRMFFFTISVIIFEDNIVASDTSIIGNDLFVFL